MTPTDCKVDGSTSPRGALAPSPNPSLPSDDSKSTVQHKVEKFEQRMRKEKEDAKRSSPRSKPPEHFSVSTLDLSSIHRTGAPTNKRSPDSSIYSSPPRSKQPSSVSAAPSHTNLPAGRRPSIPPAVPPRPRKKSHSLLSSSSSNACSSSSSSSSSQRKSPRPEPEASQIIPIRSKSLVHNSTMKPPSRADLTIDLSSLKASSSSSSGTPRTPVGSLIRSLSSRKISTPKSPHSPVVVKYSKTCLTYILQLIKELDHLPVPTSVSIYDWLASDLIRRLQLTDDQWCDRHGKRSIRDTIYKTQFNRDHLSLFLSQSFKQLKDRINTIYATWSSVPQPEGTPCSTLWDQQLEVGSHLYQLLVRLNKSASLQDMMGILHEKPYREIGYLRFAVETLVSGESVLTILKGLCSKKPDKLFNNALPSLCPFAFEKLSKHPISWPAAGEEGQAAVFATFADYSLDAYIQDVRGWCTPESPIFGQLRFHNDDASVEFNMKPYAQDDAGYADQNAFLVDVVKQARALGYATELVGSDADIASLILGKQFVPRFSRLLRAGANGIFAQAIFVTHQILHTNGGPYSIEHKCLDADGLFTGSTFNLDVEFVNETDFTTTYRRQARLLRRGASSSSEDPFLANLYWTWKLHWTGESDPPTGTLEIRVEPKETLSSDDQWSLLRTWALGLKSREGPFAD